MTLVDEEQRGEFDDAQEYDDNESRPLRECVRNAVDAYFLHLDGQTPVGLYKMVLAEIEAPLLEVVLRQARGNYSHAANFLGINRATLRKKIKQYQITI
uniref:Putative Fis-like DNA-binding protein n=1 Tax=Candidatus Kentrum sp. SD TaxID=2126332 RepID=A0A450YII7_9GAMM|nr:MAG: Fis family transcriptional regulator, factor for inversion stimulation protein [Candidatus Kentron sp. SD]VFK47195.1 MAG: Fis family transcriptional regulator, factor for inversion stimulation protein [Candidatus Kentron sp. SD]VFK80360.1 MAG: Fis family transcriptional regulator, factor for inversion stimulation protein [Candidatus Kentron sp. SD]